MFGRMKVSEHQRILDQVVSRQQEIHNDLMEHYVRQVDGQVMRLRSILSGEVARITKAADRLDHVDPPNPDQQVLF